MIESEVRERVIAIGGLLFVAAASYWLSASLGLIVDDIHHALLLRQGSWADVFLLELGPAPFQLVIWRLAESWCHDEPYKLARVWSALWHAANVLLIGLSLSALLGRSWGWVAAALFAVYRPGNEAYLRSAATSEMIILAFSLMALTAWRRGRMEEARWRWGAVAFVALAMLGKPSALTLPVLLALETWLFTPSDMWRAEFRKAAPALAGAVAFTIGFALNAVLRRGLWDYGELAWQETSPLHSLGRTGLALFREFFLVYPPGGVITGLLVLVTAAMAFFTLRDPCLRLGIAWSAAFLPASHFVEIGNQIRYQYAGGFGVVLIFVTLASHLSQRRLPLPGVAVAGLALWGAANLGLGTYDWLRLRAIGQSQLQMRELLLQHADEIRAGEGIVVANQPATAWRVHPGVLLRYDHELYRGVVFADECGLRPAWPCVRFDEEIMTEWHCEGPCVEWVPVRAASSPSQKKD